MTEPIPFSIIIPTYNRANLIGRTIKSVIDQTYSNFEIIIVDDESTDETDAVVRSFADIRIKYFKKQNGERAAARNFGIKQATGQYLTFLDSDDLLKRNHLEAARSFIKRNGLCQIFHLGYDVVDCKGTIIYPWKSLPNPVNEKLVEGNFLSCLGVFIRQDILLENKFNEDRELSGSEDYEFWIRLAARFQINTDPISTACLVNHDTRSVLEIDPQKLSKRIELMKKYLLADEEVLKYYRNRLNILFAYHDIYAALHFAMGRYRNFSLKILFRAFRNYVFVVFNYRFWVVIKKNVF